jgi:hypothetical protein
MRFDECERCGEEYPAHWITCPYCEVGDRPSIERFDKDED